MTNDKTHLPCCTEISVVVDIFSIFVFWVKVISGLKQKYNFKKRKCAAVF